MAAELAEVESASVSPAAFLSFDIIGGFGSRGRQ